MKQKTVEIWGFLLSLQIFFWDCRSWMLPSGIRNASWKNLKNPCQHVKYKILGSQAFYFLQHFHLTRPTTTSPQIWKTLLFHHLVKVSLFHPLIFYTSSFSPILLHLLPSSIPFFFHEYLSDYHSLIQQIIDL